MKILNWVFARLSKLGSYYEDRLIKHGAKLTGINFTSPHRALKSYSGRGSRTGKAKHNKPQF